MNKEYNICLDGWKPTPLEQALMDDTFDDLINESQGSIENVPSDLLEFQDFEDAMEEIKADIDNAMK